MIDAGIAAPCDWHGETLVGVRMYVETTSNGTNSKPGGLSGIVAIALQLR